MTLLKIFVHREAAEDPEAHKIINRLELPWAIVEDQRDVYREVMAAEDPIQRAKEILFLTRNKGAFIRKCPGTREYTCCDYMILHIGTFCSMDCAYCILQAYFHPPVLTYFVNRPALSSQLDQVFVEKTIRRIGTGEYTDSMIWEFWTDLSSYLVPKFAEQRYTALELKTKTTAIDALAGLEHHRKTIMAWSLNTPRIIRTEERGTATLAARLKAAARCESWGYPLAFHFDPIVLYDGCEEAYRDVLEQLFASVSPRNIAWISLGTFRFMQDLKSIIQKRFMQSKIIYGEFIPGLDGKMRYFKPLRIRMYRKMATWIREMAPDVLVYFCMEDDEVWKNSLGFVPDDRGGLPKMLDDRSVEICGLDHP